MELRIINMPKRHLGRIKTILYFLTENEATGSGDEPGGTANLYIRGEFIKGRLNWLGSFIKLFLSAPEDEFQSDPLAIARALERRPDPEIAHLRDGIREAMGMLPDGSPEAEEFKKQYGYLLRTR